MVVRGPIIQQHAPNDMSHIYAHIPPLGKHSYLLSPNGNKNLGSYGDPYHDLKVTSPTSERELGSHQLLQPVVKPRPGRQGRREQAVLDACRDPLRSFQRLGDIGGVYLGSLAMIEYDTI